MPNCVFLNMKPRTVNLEDRSMRVDVGWVHCISILNPHFVEAGLNRLLKNNTEQGLLCTMFAVP